jgi:hypothetical protein
LFAAWFLSWYDRGLLDSEQFTQVLKRRAADARRLPLKADEQGVKQP